MGGTKLFTFCGNYPKYIYEGGKIRKLLKKKLNKIYEKKGKEAIYIFIYKKNNLLFYFSLVLLFYSVVVLQSYCFSPVISSKYLPLINKFLQ